MAKVGKASAKVSSKQIAAKQGKGSGARANAKSKGNYLLKSGKEAAKGKVNAGERHAVGESAIQEEKIITQRREEGLEHWLGGADRFGAPLRSDFDIMDMGEAGISKASVDELAAHLGVTRKVMAENILDVSVKTMERKRPSEKLDKKISSHALEIARLMEHAYNVFEDEERVRQWLNRENRALQGRKPIAIFDTLTGINLVNNILTRIEEGVYS